MNAEHTHDWLRREVAQAAEERSVPFHRAFAAWALAYIHELEPDDAFAQTATAGGERGGDLEVDGWYRAEADDEFHLWRCMWSDDSRAQFEQDPADQLINAFEAILAPENAASYGCQYSDIAGRLQLAMEHEYDVVLNVAVAASFKEDVREQLAERIAHVRSQIGRRIDVRLWDLAAFQSTYDERHPTSETLNGQKFTFQLQHQSLLNLTDADGVLPSGWRAVVVSLNAKSLGTVAKQIGPKLFDLNVRFALGVNRRIKNIRNTLSDAEQSSYFWLYNNGITILCDDFSFEIDGDVSRLEITNPQVVNGCQTINAFRALIESYGDAPAVLARVISPPNTTEGRDQANRIAFATNSQNPILDRDLRSNDVVQRRLQRAFDQLDPPWFYERKRGEWSTLTSVQKARYRDGDSGDRRLDMEREGQSWWMLFSPAEAITRKKRLFEEDEIYQRVFTAQRSPKQYLFAELLRRAFESFWHGRNFEAIRRICGEHMTDVLLRRMMRAKMQIVAHSMALSRQLLQSESENWTSKDAQAGLGLIPMFETSMAKWLRLLGGAFVQYMGKLGSDEEAFPLKRSFERGDDAAFGELWTHASTIAAFSLGPDWSSSLRQELIAVTDL
jgi:hypothetical protein